MTIPSERRRSIEKTRNFLRSLLDPKQTPRIPKWIREEAYWCLRHFPAEYHMEQAAEQLPEVFGEQKFGDN